MFETPHMSKNICHLLMGIIIQYRPNLNYHYHLAFIPSYKLYLVIHIRFDGHDTVIKYKKIKN